MAKEPDNSIMTLSELANYLKVAEKTVVRMAREGKIPATKVASQWRFMREIVDEWLKSRMEPIRKDNLFELIKTAPEVVPLSRLFSPDMMLFDVQPGTVPEVLEQLIQPLEAKGVIKDRKRYLELLIQREELHSTAITDHVAIPHVRMPDKAGLTESALVFGHCSKGVDFGGNGNGPTHLFILICSEDEVVHLRLLGKISRLLNRKKIVNRLMKCKNSEQVIGLLAETEWELAVKED